MLAVLVVAGCFFPLLAWVTFALSMAAARQQRHVSGIYIPLIGPLLLNMAQARSAMPGWTMLLPWLLDLGTVMLVCALPELAAELWRTSRCMRLFTLSGVRDGVRVELSFYRNGHYLLKMRWTQAPGTAGPIQLGEPGTYTRDPDGTLHLRCGQDRSRTIVADGTARRVIDGGAAGYAQLDGWRLARAP